MLSHRVFSILLIGIGLGSPWLVRDWLSSDNRDQSKISPTSSRPEKSVTTKPSSASASAQGASRSPYPLAHPDSRLLEGFFKSSDTAPKTAIPETPRSRAITEAATLRLKPELEKLGFRSGAPVILRLFKEEHELEIWMRPDSDPLFSLFKIVRLTTSSGYPGPKTHEGDGQTPEGFYFILPRNLRPNTQHYLGLDIGYPNEHDRQLNRTGSDLMLHAGKTAAGGYAVSQEAMEDVYTLCTDAFRQNVPVIPIQIFPFRLTDQRMDRVLGKGSAWLDEWSNLKEGYDFFENVRQAPQVEAISGVYHFRIDRKKI